MQLSAKPILLLDTSYSDTSTTHVIIKHIMLLSQAMHRGLITTAYMQLKDELCLSSSMVKTNQSLQKYTWRVATS